MGNIGIWIIRRKEEWNRHIDRIQKTGIVKVCSNKKTEGKRRVIDPEKDGSKASNDQAIGMYARKTKAACLIM